MSPQPKPGWHERGYLPHRDSAALLQHIVLSALPGARLDTPAIADRFEQALLHFDADHYSLQAWVVMPDHAHVAVTFRPDIRMGQAVRSWKCWTQRGARSLLFGPDYFDRYARTLDQADRLRGYVEGNPVAAGLVARADSWRWSSAWHRANGRRFDTTWRPFFLPKGSR
jgi:REP element-mobilizing transposase RayT